MPTATTAPTSPPRSTKRLKRTHAAAPPAASLSLSLPHPLNVKPAGNALVASGPLTRHLTLGNLAVLPDEVITHVLTIERDDDGSEDTILAPRDLAALSLTSHGVRAFANSEALWRHLFVRMYNGRMEQWCGSWKQTFGWHHSSLRKQTSPLARIRPQQPFYSDALYLPHRLGLLDVQRYIPAHPGDSTSQPSSSSSTWTATPIPRLPADVPLEEFHAQYAVRNRPCILEAPVQPLPGLGMDIQRLRDVYPKRWVRAEAIRTTVQVYADYARGCARHQHVVSRAVSGEDGGEDGGEDDVQEADTAYDPMSVPDEAPYYLFDSQLPSQMAQDGLWTVPSQMQQCPADVYGVPGLGGGGDDGESAGGHADEGATAAGITPRSSLPCSSRTLVEADLFSLLSSSRPDHRWLIAGPARSGSGWHKDPNYTSAWNTPLSGRKLWFMLPPDVTPPGVYVSPDGGEVTAPLSLAEWLDAFWGEAIKLHGRGKRGDGTLQHAVCRPGETVYVPSGWWHLVVNLEESVALTQNFVSLAELPQVLWFMRDKWEQVSGFRAGAEDKPSGVPKGRCARQGEEEEEEDNEPDDDAPTSSEKDPRRALYSTFLSALRAYSPALAEWAVARAGEIQAHEVALASMSVDEGQSQAASTGEVRRPKPAARKKDADAAGAAGGTWWERLKAEEGGGEGADGGAAEATTTTGGGGLFASVDVGEEEMGDVPW